MIPRGPVQERPKAAAARDPPVVRRRESEHAARWEKRRRFLEHEVDIGEVLDHVPERDGRNPAGKVAPRDRLEGAGDRRDAQLFPHVFHRPFKHVQTVACQPGLSQRGEKGPVGAPHVHHGAVGVRGKQPPQDLHTRTTRLADGLEVLQIRSAILGAILGEEVALLVAARAG